LDVVQLGNSVSALNIVSSSQDLFAGEVLSIKEGGEGVLYFGSGMRLRLRLFNNTQVGVTSASAPGTTFNVRLFLEDRVLPGFQFSPGAQDHHPGMVIL
jgi:hypothetical protein